MDIQLPEGVSQKDALAFLSYLKGHPIGEPRRKGPKESCSNCRFEEGCFSINCLNEVYNHKMPSRWLPKRKE